MAHPLRALFVGLAALTAPSSWAAVGVVPSTTKVRPDHPVPAAQEILLQAARGEWEGFQLVVRDATALDAVDVRLSPLVGPGGDELSFDRSTVYREVFLDITTGSPGGLTLHEREPGPYPDPLVPFDDPWSGVPAGAPFDLAAAETGAVFLDLFVPADAAPGTYEGSVSLVASSGELATIAVSVAVWDFELPAERTIATSFGFAESLVAHFHGGPTGGADLQPIVDRYYAALHDHRLDPTTIDGPLDFAFDTTGQLLPVDWTAYDAAVGPWLDGSRFHDGVGVTRFNVGRFRPGVGTGGLTDDEYRQAAAAFAQHLVSKGWWDRAYVYALDEPYTNGGEEAYRTIHEDIARLLAASEHWRGHVLVTSPYHPTLDGDIGIWCPVTPMLGDWFYPTGTYEDASFYASLTEAELWFYVCNANFPPSAGYDIDTPTGFEPRIVKWSAFAEGARGFLYWRTNYWVGSDPWNRWADPEEFGTLGARNGDGFLLYPGDHDGTAGGVGSPPEVTLDGPVVSYRLKQVRDGLEDWELFALASRLGGEDYTRAQVGRAHVRFGDFFVERCGASAGYCPDDQPWTLDAELLQEVRANVAAKVLFLTDPERWPDPEATGDPAVDEESGCGGCDSGGGALGLVLMLLGAAAIRRGQGPQKRTPT